MNIRRLLFDVDKALARPSLLEIAEAISGCNGVKALNIAVGDVDTETLVGWRRRSSVVKCYESL